MGTFSEGARRREEHNYKIAKRRPALSLKRFAKPFLNTQPCFVLCQDKIKVKKDFFVPSSSPGPNRRFMSSYLPNRNGANKAVLCPHQGKNE